MPAESSLIPIIQEAGRDIFSQKYKTNFDSVVEVGATHGIADVVFYNYDDEAVAKRERMQIAPIESQDVLKTLLLIKNKRKLTFTYLVETLPFSEQKLKRDILGYLEETGIVTREKDYYMVDYQYDIGLKKSVAIEAKVRDWKRGLYQAQRYRWFAEASYLAIYEDYITQPQKNLNLFEFYNVGLLSVGNNGVDVLYSPKSQKPESVYQKALTYERLLARSY